MRYQVRWEIDIEDATSPEDAAKQAWEHMRRSDSTANVFDVQEDGSGEYARVDLQEVIESAPAQPLEDDEPHRFRNFYDCPRCGEAWDEAWSCACHSECPECGERDISPSQSDDLDEETPA